MSKKYDFFVSYTKDDADWANWIVWQLREDGFDCVIQQDDFVPGDDFIRRMREALESCRLMIAVFSDKYFDSRFAQLEMQAAFAAGIVLPVWVKKCEIPVLYKPCVYIDLVGSKEGAHARDLLLDGVQAAIAGQRRASPDGLAGRPVFPGQVVPQGSPIAARERRRSGPLKVLFLGSAADTGLDIAGQFKSIRSSVAEARYPRGIKFAPVFDVTAELLFTKLNESSPDVFHFSGKQDAGRILLRTETGEVRSIPEAALAGMFRSLDRGLVLAIIDTCYSRNTAKQIVEAVDCAIGVRGGIYEDEATHYYSALYKAIASGRSLRDACGQAETFAVFKGAAKSRLPELFCRPGIDPSRVKLVTPPASARKRR